MILFDFLLSMHSFFQLNCVEAYAAAQGAQANAIVGHGHGQGSYTTVQKTISHVSSAGSRY